MGHSHVPLSMQVEFLSLFLSSEFPWPEAAATNGKALLQFSRRNSHKKKASAQFVDTACSVDSLWKNSGTFTCASFIALSRVSCTMFPVFFLVQLEFCTERSRTVVRANGSSVQNSWRCSTSGSFGTFVRALSGGGDFRVVVPAVFINITCLRSPIDWQRMSVLFWPKLQSSEEIWCIQPGMAASLTSNKKQIPQARII